MAGDREKLLTASDLASLCEVDLKTIHNWVERGRVPHFRTPGRHLRFRAQDVAEFLKAWGYAVPRELLAIAARRVLVVGSSETFAAVARAAGETGGGEQPSSGLRFVQDPYDALVLAGAEPPDVIVFDVGAIDPIADVVAMVEAIERALPSSALVALVVQPHSLELPARVAQIDKGDQAALGAHLGASNVKMDPHPVLHVPARAGGASR